MVAMASSSVFHSRCGANFLGGGSHCLNKTTHERRGILRLLCRADGSLPSDESVKKNTKQDMLQKLAKAREYKTQKPQKIDDDNVLNKLNDYAAQQATEESAQFLQAQQELVQIQSQQEPTIPDTDDRAFRRGSGNANQAANWLQTIATDNTVSDLSRDLRPEEFTLQKEEAKKTKGVTIERAKGIIQGTRRRLYTEDGYGLAQQQDEAQKSMADDRKASSLSSEMAALLKQQDQERGASRKQQEEQDEEQQNFTEGSESPVKDSVHKPAVATWGVFPRPKNISQAYGGGRNLRPGEQLESAEQAEQRQQRVSAALSSYRKSLGLDIDPVIEQQATELTQAGDNMFKAGRISAALEMYAEAASLVPLRTKIGGRANLQRAICLDSLGRNGEAYSIYKSLEGHTGPGVAKAAKRMLFGFKAAENLKVSTLSYAPPSKAWQTYFDQFGNSAWAEYKASKEESEEDEQFAFQAMLVAAAVCLTPVVVVGALIAKP